jgi:hypothetical protein
MVVKAKSSTRKSKPQKSESKHGTPKQGNIYDAFAKQMLCQILVFADFLQHYADKKFVSEIDLNGITSAPTHYFGKDGTEQIMDLIFHCPLLNGGGNLMAVIIFEHQSGNLKKIPHKLLKYIASIWDAELKEGKPLSAPYFIVLRTGKKPHKGKLPKVTDRLPKGRDGKPLGKTVEIDYDIVDLPAWDFDQLVGGAVLRLTLGLLHKMAGGNIDDLPEALKPLMEITDAEERVELGKDVLPFAAKVFAANNRRLDEAQMDEVLKPIFTGKERAMIKTVFEEKFDEGIAVGEARSEVKWKAEMVLKAIRRKFKQVPKKIEDTVLAMTDPIALDSMHEHAIGSNTLDEFTSML